MICCDVGLPCLMCRLVISFRLGGFFGFWLSSGVSSCGNLLGGPRLLLLTAVTRGVWVVSMLPRTVVDRLFAWGRYSSCSYGWVVVTLRMMCVALLLDLLLIMTILNGVSGVSVVVMFLSSGVTVLVLPW